MKQRRYRLLASALILLLGVVGLSATKTQSPAAAADASRFDPGMIISDSVFFDFGSMTQDAIQRFLENQVPNCKAIAGQPKCLRDYTTNIPDTIGVAGHCASVSAQQGVKASAVIYQVARACGVNPRVLLVLLQKEQGLVQATNPSIYMYNAATGYGCPDSDPAICGKVFAGLFNQLYKAAGQFQWYGNPSSPFSRIKIGKVNNILYNPKSSCGTASILIKNQATADLYYYTPYTPNAAALKNLYGSGDSCSAYGNRNFWRFYSDWFGSTVGGGFLLKSATSGVYLIVNNNKYLVSDTDLIAALKPLGPLGTISQDYLDSFTTAGNLNRLVKSVTGQYYFVDAGQKYPLASCSQATSLGLDCSTAVQLTANELSALPSGAAMTQHIGATDGSEYLIVDGVKRQILDSYSANTAGYNLEQLAAVPITAFAYLPWGAPIANDKTMFLNASTGNYGVYVSGVYYQIDKSMFSDVNFAKWFTMSTGSLTNDGISKVNSGVAISPFVLSPDGSSWLISDAGKMRLTNPDQVLSSAPQVSNELLNAIPSISGKLTAPAFVQGAKDKRIYYLSAGVRRPTYSAADRLVLAAGMTDPQVLQISASALAQLTAGPLIYAPGDVVQSTKTANKYWVTDVNTLVKITTTADAAQFGLSTIKPIKAAAFTGYTSKLSLAGMKVICGDQIYIASAGRYYAIDASASAHYPGSVLMLNSLICSKLNISTVQFGRFIRTPDKKFWLVQKGKRRYISTTAKYLDLRGTMLAAVAVDAAFAAKIPVGTVAPSVLIEPTPTPTPSKTPTATPTPTVTPKPTATPTPSKSASATPSPSKTPTPTPKPTTKLTTYKVAAGDTLTTIAKKFATTVTKLKSLNSLTSDYIKVGQILKLP